MLKWLSLLKLNVMFYFSHFNIRVNNTTAKCNHLKKKHSHLSGKTTKCCCCFYWQHHHEAEGTWGIFPGFPLVHAGASANSGWEINFIHSTVKRKIRAHTKWAEFVSSQRRCIVCLQMIKIIFINVSLSDVPTLDDVLPTIRSLKGWCW